MCGIVGVVGRSAVNQLIYDALLLLQHRGQDATGIVTEKDRKFFMHKAKGMVRDVFRTRNMRALPGNVGLGQVRYPTAGSSTSEEEAQPFYVNAPFGIVLVADRLAVAMLPLASRTCATSAPRPCCMSRSARCRSPGCRWAWPRPWPGCWPPAAGCPPAP